MNLKKPLIIALTAVSLASMAGCKASNSTEKKTVANYLDTIQSGDLQKAAKKLSANVTDETWAKSAASYYSHITAARYGQKFYDEAIAYEKETTKKWILSYSITSVKTDDSGLMPTATVKTHVEMYNYNYTTFTGGNEISAYMKTLMQGIYKNEITAIEKNAAYKSDSDKQKAIYSLLAKDVFIKMREYRDAVGKTSGTYSFKLEKSSNSSKKYSIVQIKQ